MLTEENEKLVEFGISGLCNLCLGLWNLCLRFVVLNIAMDLLQDSILDTTKFFLLDKTNKEYILQNDGVENVVTCLSRWLLRIHCETVVCQLRIPFIINVGTELCFCPFVITSTCFIYFSANEETVLNSITTLMYLITPESKKGWVFFLIVLVLFQFPLKKYHFSFKDFS